MSGATVRNVLKFIGVVVRCLPSVVRFLSLGVPLLWLWEEKPLCEQNVLNTCSVSTLSRNTLASQRRAHGGLDGVMDTARARHWYSNMRTRFVDDL